MVHADHVAHIVGVDVAHMDLWIFFHSRKKHLEEAQVANMGNTQIQFPGEKSIPPVKISHAVYVLSDYHLLAELLPACLFAQYGLKWEKEAINDLIEKAILEADQRGVRVLSLGLLNQACYSLALVHNHLLKITYNTSSKNI